MSAGGGVPGRPGRENAGGPARARPGPAPPVGGGGGGRAGGGFRAGRVGGGDGGPVHVGRFVGGGRVGGAAAHRAVPEPPLRGHAVVPRRDVQGGGADVRAAGRGRRAGIHRGRGGGPAGPAGDRAQPARPAGGLLPPGTPAAERLPAAAAGGE